MREVRWGRRHIKAGIAQAGQQGIRQASAGAQTQAAGRCFTCSWGVGSMMNS